MKNKILSSNYYNVSECSWPSHQLLESLIEEMPMCFEDIILSIVEELINEKNDLEQLWLKPHHAKLITASVYSKKIFFYVVNIFSRITLFFMLNSKQSFLLVSIMKGFIIQVKNICNKLNFDFIHLFPRDLQALVLLLERDVELYTRYLLQFIKKLFYNKLNTHSLSCSAIFLHFREWLSHINNTSTYDDI